MHYVGSCPHCGARLEVAPPPPPFLTCGSCARRCMLVLPEVEANLASSGDVRIDVLPWKERSVRDSWLARWGLRQPVLILLAAACVLALAFLIVGLLFQLEPGSSLAERAAIVLALAAGFLFVGLPATVVLSTLVAWALLGPRRRWGPDVARSVIAVTSGVLTLATCGCLVLSLRTWLPSGLPVAVDWTSDVIAGICAGWVAARLSPSAPYRHALGVALVILTGLLLVAFVASIPKEALWVLPLASAAYLLFVPVLLLGAWIGARRGVVLPS